MDRPLLQGVFFCALISILLELSWHLVDLDQFHFLEAQGMITAKRENTKMAEEKPWVVQARVASSPWQKSISSSQSARAFLVQLTSHFSAALTHNAKFFSFAVPSFPRSAWGYFREAEPKLWCWDLAVHEAVGLSTSREKFHSSVSTLIKRARTAPRSG